MLIAMQETREMWEDHLEKKDMGSQNSKSIVNHLPKKWNTNWKARSVLSKMRKIIEVTEVTSFGLDWLDFQDWLEQYSLLSPLRASQLSFCQGEKCDCCPFSKWNAGPICGMLKARLIQHLLSRGQGSSLAENSFVAFSPPFVITFIALRLFLLCTHHCCRTRYFLSPTGGWIYSFQWYHNIEQLVIVPHCLPSHTLLLCQPQSHGQRLWKPKKTCYKSNYAVEQNI